MAKTVEGLYYSESHEWVKVEGDVAIIGITDFAQHSMGDLSYVDMPAEEDELQAGDEFGAVESVKAASDLFSPVSGTVIEINEALGPETAAVFQSAGFEEISVLKDLSEKDRFVKFKKSNKNQL